MVLLGDLLAAETNPRIPTSINVPVETVALRQSHVT